MDPRTVDLTWTWEDIELAPDWIQDEILEAPHRLDKWLSSQRPAPDGDGTSTPPKPRKRGRPPKR